MKLSILVLGFSGYLELEESSDIKICILPCLLASEKKTATLTGFFLSTVYEYLSPNSYH